MSVLTAEQFWATLPHCCGYPKCDGDLVATEHSEECPLHGKKELTCFEFANAFAATIRKRTPADAKAALDALIARKSVFVDGEFTSHSGLKLPYKIEADNFTDAEMELFAKLIAQRAPKFCSVYGIPKGGERLAKALSKYCVVGGDYLLVDDVCTTGASLEKAKAEYDEDYQKVLTGYVIFARGPLASWCRALFHTEEQIASAEARVLCHCTTKLRKVAIQCGAGGHTQRQQMFEAIATELEHELRANR